MTGGLSRPPGRPRNGPRSAGLRAVSPPSRPPKAGAALLELVVAAGILAALVGALRPVSAPRLAGGRSPRGAAGARSRPTPLIAEAVLYDVARCRRVLRPRLTGRQRFSRYRPELVLRVPEGLVTYRFADGRLTREAATRPGSAPAGAPPGTAPPDPTRSRSPRPGPGSPSPRPGAWSHPLTKALFQHRRLAGGERVVRLRWVDGEELLLSAAAVGRGPYPVGTRPVGEAPAAAPRRRPGAGGPR